jgi:hypothetical protein
MRIKMAVINVSGQLQGSSSAQASAGMRFSATAQCFGMSSSADAKRAQLQAEATPTPVESTKPG